jgi:hypothetical protein
MVLEINAQFHSVNKFVVSFLTSNPNTPKELIDQWKHKNNLNKLRTAVRKVDQPNHPPRPKSKYIFFCDTVRPEIIKENPNMSIRDVTCELGRRWQKFKLILAESPSSESPEAKLEEKISAAFEIDKKRYDTDKSAMKTKEEKKNKFRSKYIYFCDQERIKTPKITMKELGLKWNNTKNDIALFEKYSILFETKKKQYLEQQAKQVFL